MQWLRTIARVDDGALVVEQMELDETASRSRPAHRTARRGRVVLALGQDSDLSLWARRPASRSSRASIDTRRAPLATSRPGVFAGGDMAPGERSVTTAVGHGRRGGPGHRRWLAGRCTPRPRRRGPGAVRGPQHLVLRGRPPHATGRASSWPGAAPPFDEVVHGLDGETALYEARRCLSCGSCFSCDNCYAMCPDAAIVIKLGPPGVSTSIDLDYCKGCGLCVARSARPAPS